MFARSACLLSGHLPRALRVATYGGGPSRHPISHGAHCITASRALASDAASGGFGSRFSRWISGDDQDGRGGEDGQGEERGGRGDKQDDSDPSSDGFDAILVNEGPSPLKYQQVLAVPLPRMPLYPGIMMPVTIKDEDVVKEIKRLGEGGLSYVGAFLARDKALLAEEADRPLTPADMIYDIGSLAHVRTVTDMEGGGARVELVGHRRIRKGLSVSEGPPLTIKVDHLRDDSYDRSSAHLKATVMEVIATLQDLVVHNPLYREKLQYVAQLGIDINDASKLADLGAYLTSADEAELQQVMEELRVEERLNLSLQLLKNEIQLSKLQAEIGKNVEAKLSDAQRRYFLQEQLKQIKKELGMEKDDKSAVISKLEEKFAPFKAGAGEEVQRAVEDEMAKLGGLEPSSSEFNITRNYLDWLTSIPWGHTVEETLDIARAQRVLDEDHHGLGDVKERILEFIAVARLRGSTQGKIICLSGPPGVGKTSVVKSVARALDRPFFRFSVGGLSDVAEIRGHRRTYVGAMPGKLVQGLKSTGACNPVVLIDEVDKLGRGLTGDPASALLEVLDPEQNASFVDHYLDVPLDLSKVLFICTANVLDTIPAPLLDRMEVIRLSGYIADEKAAIARQYLEPRARERAGVGEGQARLLDEAIAALIEDYAREAGVRALNNHLEKIYRKVALQLVREEEAEGAEGEGASRPASRSLIKIAPGDLADYLGQPTFTSDHMYDPNPVGVVTGLAWTAMGGSTLHIEGSVVESDEGKGSVRTTGQLGDVMKESAVIAHVYARRLLEEREPGNRFFADSVLHVHVPAGAVPKDGPSAGCTIITALMSLAIGRAPRPDMAMTGEVTLTGRILPIGGVREKAVAARRAHVRLVVLPEGNRRDWDELPADVRAGLDARFVSDYREIYDIAFEYE